MTAKLPCEHEKYDKHGDCGCHTQHSHYDKTGSVRIKGWKTYGRDEYTPDTFHPCNHQQACPGGEYIKNSTQSSTHTYTTLSNFTNHAAKMEQNGWTTTNIVNPNMTGLSVIVATYQKDNT